MAHKRPTNGEWISWKARFTGYVSKYAGREDDLGKFALRLKEEAECFYTFLREHDIEPTNNRAERAVRTPVVRRKISYGATSAEGERWVERALTLRETCKLNGRSYFDELTDAITCYYRGKTPDLAWVHEVGRIGRRS